MNLRQQVTQSVVKFVKEIYPTSYFSIEESTTLRSLSLDSLDIVELSMELEDQYEIDMRPVPVNWITVKDVVDCVVKLKASA